MSDTGSDYVGEAMGSSSSELESAPPNKKQKSAARTGLKKDCKQDARVAVPKDARPSKAARTKRMPHLSFTPDIASVPRSRPVSSKAKLGFQFMSEISIITDDSH